ncbi:hypothetical protein [Lentimicrobium sp.]|uniref:hypothetical protein n=1 Tax=Lentimicrobium sp. TaxID=2034841 RepID=UPI002CBD80B0|nr:hypothetical protein [Lentimicrobium sp.]MCO5263807.1 hypothetical protein [Lentimicrobium sp.]HPJ63741.1 hypothetical protein [Lentimicrobium sp.]HPR27500.1 hypothetical protein [Lentimicrobium sp.]HRW68848.1 hypothetical protein [Lentimicrobium sp.]
MSIKKTVVSDPVEQELKNFIDKLNNENAALSKILSGVSEFKSPAENPMPAEGKTGEVPKIKNTENQ